MKQTMFAAVLLVTVISCSKPTNKFVGYWKPIPGSKLRNSSAMWIGQFDKNYCKMVFYKYEPNDTTSLVYRKKEDALFGHFKSDEQKVLYLKDKDHLFITRVTPIEGAIDVELERVPETEIPTDVNP